MDPQGYIFGKDEAKRIANATKWVETHKSYGTLEQKVLKSYPLYVLIPVKLIQDGGGNGDRTHARNYTYTAIHYGVSTQPTLGKNLTPTCRQMGNGPYYVGKYGMGYFQPSTTDKKDVQFVLFYANEEVQLGYC